MKKVTLKKRSLLPDPKFNDPLVSRFVNNLMKNGKKNLAYNIFYGAMKIVKERNENKDKNELEIWKQALTNIMPHVEVRSRRVGGSTFHIPRQISPYRKISIAMKWLICYSRKRNEKSMSENLAAEIIAASKEEGLAVKKRIDTHKMAESNKAFSHFRL
ncbi:MAG: 30S ribosomal protein S7 [Candidatus Walczuchella monophlebidarum]